MSESTRLTRSGLVSRPAAIGRGADRAQKRFFERLPEQSAIARLARTGFYSDPFCSLPCYADAGRCAFRNERTCRTAMGIRSLGSFQGYMLTSAFGASIAASIATL